MKEIIFYRSLTGRCPVEEFLDSLNDKQVTKILWVFRLIKEVAFVPKEYFKKMAGTDDLWEVRVSFGNKIFRFFGFFDRKKFIILTNGFVKKSKKTPKKEIDVAHQRRKDYFERKK